jgi:hypothetical protein
VRTGGAWTIGGAGSSIFRSFSHESVNVKTGRSCTWQPAAREDEVPLRRNRAAIVQNTQTRKVLAWSEQANEIPGLVIIGTRERDYLDRIWRESVLSMDVGPVVEGETMVW